MDVPIPESLFFMDLPDLRELCTVKIFLNPGTPNYCIRDAQIKICRHLLFLYDQIVASPNPEQFDQITVIMAISFYRTGKVQSVAEKYASKVESPERITLAQLQACLFYTVTLRLSPHWNKAGHLLIQDLRIVVSDTQICICVQVQKIQLSPSEYGYELPSMPEDKVIYCSVYFKLIGEKLFTYPFICLRSQPIQFYPRVDMARIVDAFISDLKSKLSHLCGFPIRITENPVYTVMELTRPQLQDQTSLVNLTSKLPSGSLFQDSRYIAATHQKMVPVKQGTKEHVLEKVHPAKPASASLKMEPFTSSPWPLHISCSSERHEETVQRYVPTFNRKNVKVNSGHFQITKQDQSMFSSCIPHSFKEHNSTSLAVSSVMVLPKPTQPSFSQIMDDKANLSVRKLANRSMIIKNNIEKISRNVNVTQHPHSIALGKHQLCSASCQIQAKSRPVLNSNGAEALQSHRGDSCEINCIKQIPAGISHKNQNAENVSLSSTECLTQEVSMKEQLFDFNPKRRRTKKTIKEVDVLKHAKNNELHRLNNATLQDWLKQHGISTKPRSKKEKLVAEIMQFLQKC